VTESDFAFLRGLIKSRSGLDLGPEKRYLAESRLGPLSRASGLRTLDGLMRRLRAGGDEKLARAVVDAMATHETLFFRDRAPFEALRTTILPALAGSRPPGRPLRIWSAAASTGQEAYSLAMVVKDMANVLAGRRVEILATDLSADAIERARTGIYTQFEVQRGLPIRALLLHFTQCDGGWEILPELRRTVDFRVVNLLEDIAALGTFDVILCRNLLIYLDAPTKKKLLAKLSGALAPDGFLALGAAETTIGLSRNLPPHPEAPGFFTHILAGSNAGLGLELAAVSASATAIRGGSGRRPRAV
jgi:chemotaxis protein methyltransferase CheR